MTNEPEGRESRKRSWGSGMDVPHVCRGAGWWCCDALVWVTCGLTWFRDADGTCKADLRACYRDAFDE